jgi:protein PhnA
MDGDIGTVIKDFQYKSLSAVVNIGGRVKNIRILDWVYDKDCKFDGIGAMQLKSLF